MYFIESEAVLKDKKIIFTHLARFADQMIIVTEDKGIFMFTQDEEGIEIYREHNARNCLYKNDYVRKELNSLGVITDEEINDYKKKIKEKFEKQEKFRKEQEEIREHQEYLRLKEKFESKSN